jgi:hypothetical protein
MIPLLLGLACLLVLMGALGRFSRASVSSLRQMGIWVAAIGGLLLAALLFLVGRGAGGLAALVFLGPLVWSWVIQPAVRRPGGNPDASPPRQPARPGAMTPDEAREVLGVAPGATREEIRSAYLRLMAAAHPDRGGSDWLASRVNQARDVLLG